MNKPKATEFLGLFVVVLFLFTLAHYIVSRAFMVGLAQPYLYFNESALGYLLSSGTNGYLSIVLSVTAGMIVYVAGVALIGYVYVKLPLPRKKKGSGVPVR
jgi:hypothetical protein